MFFSEKHKKIDFLKAHHEEKGFSHDISKAFKKPEEKKHFLKTTSHLLVFLLVIFILVSSVTAVLFFKFKNIYELAMFGKGSLEYSVDAGSRKDFRQMLESSKEAEKYFSNVLDELDALSNNLFVQRFALAKEQIAEVEYLIESARVISKGVEKAATIASEMDNILGGKFGENFAEFHPEEKERLLKLIYEQGPELNGVKANFDLALVNLERIEANGILSPFSERIKNLKQELSIVLSSLSKTIIASQILPELAGYPKESTFLIMFQNNTELRPTGGFLGTYGILQTKNGDLVRFDTHDIYHMDMPAQVSGNFQIMPPYPIKEYLNRNWYMRDANWSPDWPTSARQIEWFYHKENALLSEENQINNFSGEFNGVIAITPELVTNLLDVIGPIKIGEEEFSKDNFVELLQYKVEQDFDSQDITSWKRKEIIGKILEEIKIKLFNLHYSNWLRVAKQIEESINKKDILIFFKDEYLEDLAKKINIAGEIKEVEGDYFMVVDSNMAALKTDAVMKKSIKYSLKEEEDGFVAKLRINYSHEGSRDWKTDDYKTYTRVYVPEGAHLIKSEGGEVVVKEEVGKTFFGVYFKVKAGRSGSLYFEYKLPTELSEYIKDNQYELFCQKQPGSNIDNLELDFELLKEVKSYSSRDIESTAEKFTPYKVKWNTDFNTDKEFNIKF